MQKILSLVWFKIYPPYFGGQKGIAFFNKELAKYFAVDCLCSVNNETIENAGCSIIPELPVNKSQFINPFILNKISKRVRRENYSFIILEFPYFGFFGAWLKNKNRKLIIHTHNIESERFRSFHKKGWKLLRYYERWSLQHADLVIFKTTEDKVYAIQHFGIKEKYCYVLPYGIEKQLVKKALAKQALQDLYGIAENEKILLFAGTLDYEPNRHAVEIILNELLPILKNKLEDFRVIICGKDAKEKLSPLRTTTDPHIIFAGFVNHIETYFSAADVFINPVENVHGIQTKIMDALSFDLNVVCFQEPLSALPGYLVNNKVFPAKTGDYKDFVSQILQSLSVNFATPERFFSEFSWQNIVKNFAAFLNSSHQSKNNQKPKTRNQKL
jgi:polysaccharide biosynthesis protein PslH